MDDYTAGAAIEIPVMRVEEMYFIDAEATAHVSGLEAGVDVNDFVIYSSTTYNSWHAQNKYGLFMLQEFQTSEMTEPAYWVWFCFQLK